MAHALTRGALLLVIVGCSAPLDGLDESGPFAGRYRDAGVTFATGYAQIRSDTLTVNFSTQANDDCRNATLDDGTIHLTFGIDAPSWVGEFPLQETLVGATIFATAITFSVEPDGGRRSSKSELLTEGRIRIDAVEDGGVSGWGKATAPGANFAGNFNVPWCAL